MITETVSEINLPRRFLRQPPRTEPGERIYAIGDIHGRADLFLALLRSISRDQERQPLDGRATRIVVLGDFIDRGPSSRQILEALSRVPDRQALTVLMGNHEECLLACATGMGDPRDGWLDFGGRETLASYDMSPPEPDQSKDVYGRLLTERIGQQVVDWLASLPLFAISGDYVFVHAGLRPGIALKRQSSRDLLWIRDEFLSSTKAHSHFVVHGHSIVDQVEVRANRIGVDTGAWRSGRLTALALEDDRAWLVAVEDEHQLQSPARLLATG